MSTITIALAQVNSTDDPTHNLGIIEQKAAVAAGAGAAVVVFPEAMMRRFGGTLADIAEPLDGPWATAVRQIAQRENITIVAGMFTPADGDRVRNTLLVTGPGVDAGYDKIHLYDAFGFAESDTVAPGDRPLTVTIGGVTIGFATCYDLRFPELFHTLADNGAEVIVVSASWGAGPGKADQWQLLARARALDSTSFVVACDQADPAADGVEVTGTAPLGVGYSVAVGPTGEVIGELEGAAADLLVEIDTEQVAKTRSVLPVLANRRRLS